MSEVAIMLPEAPAEWQLILARLPLDESTGMVLDFFHLDSGCGG